MRMRIFVLRTRIFVLLMRIFVLRMRISVLRMRIFAACADDAFALLAEAAVRAAEVAAPRDPAGPHDPKLGLQHAGTDAAHPDSILGAPHDSKARFETHAGRGRG